MESSYTATPIVTARRGIYLLAALLGLLLIVWAGLTAYRPAASASPGSSFVILGPPDDPAHLAGWGAIDALKRIAATGTTWVSRRDGSATNLLELQLWQQALGRDAQHEGWYVSTHAGMLATLAEADRRQAYTFSDRATYLANADKLHLRVVIEGDPALETVP